MDKWTIRPDPTSRDPLRHLLLFKGSMADVTAILKKFGSSFGRPVPASSPEGFNLSIIVHELDSAQREKLEAVLEEMAGPSSRPRLRVAKPSTSEAPAPKPAKPIASGDAAPAIPALPAAEAALAKSFSEETEVRTPPPKRAEPVTPVPASIPSLGAAPVPVVAPVPAAAPVPIMGGGAAASPVVARPAQPLWGLIEPANERFAFETLLVGPYNRFAHAAAASVVNAPGSLYNPLFLYGQPGTGKSHVIQAIARSLGQALGAQDVVLTTGSRLSRAASAAAAQGRGGELEMALSNAKALLVDDVHLLAITEQNRAALVAAFANFFGRTRQVVVTSIYPPRALASMEEALKISLGKGWAVDLKVPGPSVQTEIIQTFLDRHDFSLSGDDAKRFQELLDSRYSESARWMRRLVRLKRLHELAGKSPKADDLLTPLFEAVSSEGELPARAELDASARYAAPPPTPGSPVRSLAIILARGEEGLAGWVARRFFETGAACGAPQTFRTVPAEGYATQEPFGVPFQIGESCVRAGADAALIVGPPQGGDLAAREAEFRHATLHVLEGLGVSAAWIGHRQLAFAPSFLRAQLDLLGF